MFDLALLNSELDLVIFLLSVIPCFTFFSAFLVQAAFHFVHHLKFRHLKTKLKTKFNISDFNLKPCPFCGCEHIQLDKRKIMGIRHYILTCEACNAGTSWEVDCETLIKIWNNRANENED